MEYIFTLYFRHYGDATNGKSKLTDSVIIFMMAYIGGSDADVIIIITWNLYTLIKIR